jgi:hypothetical protein
MRTPLGRCADSEENNVLACDIDAVEAASLKAIDRSQSPLGSIAGRPPQHHPASGGVVPSI